MEQRNEMLKEMRVSEKRRGKMVRKKNWVFFLLSDIFLPHNLCPILAKSCYTG